jgi:hypothetical protein
MRLIPPCKASIVSLLILAALGGSPAPAAAAEGGSVPGIAAAPAAAPKEPAPVAADLPEGLKTELEAAVQAKVGALLDEKNEEGAPYKRATFSRHFKKIDEDTYQTVLNRDTTSKDSMTTDRLLVTIKRDAATQKWKTVSEDLQDTYKNLIRSVPGDEDFYRFDSVSFSREGLKLSGSGGSLYKDYRQGKPVRFLVHAKDTSWEFVPGEKKFQGLYQKLRKDYAADLVFTPQWFEFSCDPASCEEILASTFKGLAPVTADKVDADLKSKYDNFLKDLKKSRKDNPFGGFQLPYEPDRRAWYVEVYSDAPQRGIALGYDNWEPREVAFSVYNLSKWYQNFGASAFYEQVYTILSEDTLKKGVNPYDLEMRDDAYSKDYDLTALRGTVELGIEDAELLTADIVFGLTAKRPLREVLFNVSRARQTEQEKKATKAPQLLINSIEDGEGHEMTWVKLGQSYGLVILPQTVPAGTAFKIHMKFQNSAAIRNWTASFSTVTRFGWLPFVRFTDMVHDFDLTLKVPQRFEVLGIGRKDSDKVENGVRVAHFVADNPVEFPCVAYGDFDKTESEVVAKKIDGTRIPVNVYVEKGGIPQYDGTRMRDIIPVNKSTVLDRANEAANSLNLYREIYGVDYPYGKLDLVNDPLSFFYGQSPSSLVFLGESDFWSQGSAGDVGGANLSKFNREVVPHEVAHQWWGSLIPNRNDGNYWFVESLAEYSCALYVEATEGWKAYLDKVGEWRRAVLDTDLEASVQDAAIMWSGSDVGGRGYQSAVYNKGPYAFHVMRMTWGKDKFFPFLKTLAQEMKGKAIVTRDIQKIAEKSFGGNMDFFFDQWFRGVGQPEYTFTYGVRESEDGKWIIEGQVEQRLLVGRSKDVVDGKYFTAVVPIYVTDAKGNELRIPLRIEGPKTAFRFPVKEKPKDVVFNKNGDSLAYDIIVRKTSG